jgi:predicted nucleic acid-binding Zn ribbon protein
MPVRRYLPVNSERAARAKEKRQRRKRRTEPMTILTILVLIALGVEQVAWWNRIIENDIR